MHETVYETLEDLFAFQGDSICAEEGVFDMTPKSAHRSNDEKVDRIGNLASSFYERFLGLDRVHGSYELPAGKKATAGKKFEGKARTFHKGPTVDLWRSHLEGKRGLGVVPIRDDNTCVFGAIDVDIYDKSLEEWEAKVQEKGLPLLLCRTKSGGAHFYLFFSEPVPAAAVRDKLIECSLAMGFANVEIFPKQSKLTGADDCGSWLNMPYFGGDSTERYAIMNGEKLGLEDFIVEAHLRAMSAKDLTGVSAPVVPRVAAPGCEQLSMQDLTNVDAVMEGAPSCLLHLTQNGFGEGQRNKGLFNLAVFAKKKFSDDWQDRVTEMNTTFMSPPLPQDEVEQVIKSVDRKGYFFTCQDSPLSDACNREQCEKTKFGIREQMTTDIPPEILRKCTDSTSAELLCLLYGDKLRFDHLRSRWLIWGDHWWVADNDGEPPRLALETARARYHAAASIDDHKIREAVAKFAIRSEDRQKISACLDLAKNFSPITDSGKNWDADPYLLGVANGVVDLRTGVLRDGKPEDRITMHTAVPFDLNAKCPRWEQFIHEVFDGDKNMIGFVRRSMGYTLTGDQREQIFFVLFGKGANGKGVLIETLRHVVGRDYSFDAGFEAFSLGDVHPEALAEMAGKRLVTSAEVREKVRLNEQRLKVLSHGDEVSARHLYGKRFLFMPTCKIWLSMNRKPNISDDTMGFWRSVRLIPFRQQFLGESRDKDLLNKLKAEATGILAWLVRGCLEWQKAGIDTPEDVTIETRIWRNETDPMVEFLETCCTEIDGWTSSAVLWGEYLNWANENMIPFKEHISRNGFGARLGDKYKAEMRRIDGKQKRGFCGIGLQDNSEF